MLYSMILYFFKSLHFCANFFQYFFVRNLTIKTVSFIVRCS